MLDLLYFLFNFENAVGLSMFDWDNWGSEKYLLYNITQKEKW